MKCDASSNAKIFASDGASTVRSMAMPVESTIAVTTTFDQLITHNFYSWKSATTECLVCGADASVSNIHMHTTTTTGSSSIGAIETFAIINSVQAPGSNTAQHTSRGVLVHIRNCLHGSIRLHEFYM
jgi:hypothetical protein